AAGRAADPLELAAARHRAGADADRAARAGPGVERVAAARRGGAAVREDGAVHDAGAGGDRDESSAVAAGSRRTVVPSTSTGAQPGAAPSGSGCRPTSQ